MVFILDLPQGVAEATTSPTLGKVGPERAGQQVPLQRGAPMHHQVGEQRPPRPRGDRGQGDTATLQQEATEEVYSKRLQDPRYLRLQRRPES